MAPPVTLREALNAIEACLAKAAEQGTNHIITIVDRGGHTLAQARMDKAIRASIIISQNKAVTAVLADMPTHYLAEACLPGGELYGCQESSCGNLVIFGGGFPITRDGEIVGGIGVSGGSVAEDMAVAEAGLGVLE